MFKTKEQRKALEDIEKMFKGLNDDYLKTVLSVAYGGEDPALLEMYKNDEDAFYQKKLDEMQLKRGDEAVLTEEERKIKEIENIKITDVIEDEEEKK